MNEHLQDLKAGGRPMKKWEIEMQKKDKEIERLKKENELLKSNPNFVYAMRNNKAIEYIKDKDFINYKKGLGNLERMLKHRQDLLGILEGKENE